MTLNNSKTETNSTSMKIKIHLNCTVGGSSVVSTANVQSPILKQAEIYGLYFSSSGDSNSSIS